MGRGRYHGDRTHRARARLTHQSPAPRRIVERAYDACASADTVAHELVARGARDAHLRMNIWWAEEWLRPDSPFKVRVLSGDERERANELLAHLCESKVFANKGGDDTPPSLRCRPRQAGGRSTLRRRPSSRDQRTVRAPEIFRDRATRPFNHSSTSCTSHRRAFSVRGTGAGNRPHSMSR